MTSPRTLLVGLDAACWSYLKPLLADGRLPVLQGLLERGASGTLASTMPPWTPTAWATLATGKNPGRHGVFDMLRRRPGGYDFTPTSDRIRQGTPFWRRLNEAGLRVGLVNVPFTFPPAALDGFVVAGFGTPESARNVTFPADALARIEAAHGPYIPVVPAATLRSGDPAAILAAEMDHQRQLVEIAVELADHYAVDVLAINLMLTDHANHKMPTMALVQAAYEQADADLGRLLAGFRPDTVMLISDHGSSRLQGDFLLYKWLADRGYTVYEDRDAREQDRALNWVLMQWLRAEKGLSGGVEKGARRALRALLPRLSAGAQARVYGRIEAAIPLARDHVRYAPRPDMRRSRVFPGSVYAGLLYLNVAGREPNGVVPAGQRAAEAEVLAAELRAVRDPESGEPLFRGVYPPQEIYDGPALDQAPDLILDAYDGRWNIRSAPYTPAPGGRLRDAYFMDAQGGGDYGWHSRDGVYVFCGAPFVTGPVSGRGALADIPATLLHLHDVPVPEDYDGAVLAAALNEAWRNRPVRRQPGDVSPSEHSGADEPVFDEMPAEEAEKLVEHLKALGYLE